MRPVWVRGIGIHPFGRFPDRDLTDLGAHAVRAALRDADFDGRRVASAYCGSVYGGVAVGHKVLTRLALSGPPTVNVEAGCASGGAAFRFGVLEVASGAAEHVLVFGVEKMPKGIIRSSFFEPWREAAGLAPTPAYFALRAQRLMLERDVGPAELAAVSVKNHAHGVHNPIAMYRKAVTVDEVLASPVVNPPLHLLMLCSPNEGAAAVVLSATPGPDRVRVAAATLRSHLPGSVLGEHTPLSGLADTDAPPPTTLAADDAYEAAGLGPDDVDFAEVQDTDAARELTSVEELRLVPSGTCGAWIRAGGGRLGTPRPINPSGGLLSKGEPLGASALGQVVELVTQLRGAAGPRQVDGARVGLAHTVGRGANASVVLLRAG
jgi:acetyl-CoA acetyltransferase